MGGASAAHRSKYALGPASVEAATALLLEGVLWGCGREAGEGRPRRPGGKPGKGCLGWQLVGTPPGKFQGVRKMQPGRRWDTKTQLGWQLVGNLNFLNFRV